MRGGRFAFRGPVHDVAGGGIVTASFALEPDGASSFLLRDFRGPPPDTSQPAFPVRAAFTYAWFPEAWDQQHIDPFTRYHPSAGFYDSGEPKQIQRQEPDSFMT